MEQCLIFCRTNFDCDNLEKFLNSLGGGHGGRWAGRRESGKENPYSCCVLAGARSTDQRRDALQVSCILDFSPFAQLLQFRGSPQLLFRPDVGLAVL